jgi:type IV pilus assembly protein PilN
MANINLLPWREELRQERQRDFVGVLALVAIMSAVVVWFVSSIYSNQVDNQGARNKFLQGEIRKLDSKIKEIGALEKERMELVERMNLIQDLQKSRPQVVHIFDEIVTTIPEGVNLSTISRKKDTLTFVGLTESSPRISNFMRNLDTSKWLNEAWLDNITPDKSSGTSRKRFILKTKVSSPLTEEVKK